MDIEERVKTLEAEFQVIKEDFRQILLDIRIYIMEMEAPFHPDFGMGGPATQYGPEKGVEPNGN